MSTDLYNRLVEKTISECNEHLKRLEEYRVVLGQFEKLTEYLASKGIIAKPDVSTIPTLCFYINIEPFNDCYSLQTSLINELEKLNFTVSLNELVENEKICVYLGRAYPRQNSTYAILPSIGLHALNPPAN